MVNFILLLTAIIGFGVSLINYNVAQEKPAALVATSVAPVQGIPAPPLQSTSTPLSKPPVASKLPEKSNDSQLLIKAENQSGTQNTTLGISKKLEVPISNSSALPLSTSSSIPSSNSLIEKPSEGVSSVVAPTQASPTTTPSALPKKDNAQIDKSIKLPISVPSVTPTVSSGPSNISSSSPEAITLSHGSLGIEQKKEDDIKTFSLPSPASISKPKPEFEKIPPTEIQSAPTILNPSLTTVAPPPSLPLADSSDLIKPVQEVNESPVSEEPSPEELLGIDTADFQESQGNWLFKRIWWERSEAKFEKIKNALSEILESRHKFFNKRSEIERSFVEPFYLKIGLNTTELQQLVSTLIKQLEAEIKKLQALENPDNELVNKLTIDNNALNQLSQSLTTINELEIKIDEALTTLLNAINKIRGYEQQAWKLFKETARILDDKKARSNYYQIDGLWKNLKDLQQYIGVEFAKSFMNLINTLKSEIGAGDQLLASLHDRKIDLKHEATLLAQSKPSSLLGNPIATIEPVQEEILEEPGIVTRLIITPIRTLITATISIFTWPLRKIFGSSNQIEDSEEPQEELGSGDEAEVNSEKEKLDTTSE